MLFWGKHLISLLFAQGDFKTIGEIPTTLPEFRLFDMFNVDASMISLAIGNALALAGLGTIDTLLTSVVADNLTKTKHNGNRELFGQGLGILLLLYLEEFQEQEPLLQLLQISILMVDQT